MTAAAVYLDVDPLQAISNPIAWFVGWAVAAVFGHVPNPLDNLMQGLVNGLDLGSTLQLPMNCTSGAQDGCIWWSVWSDLHIVFVPLLGLVLSLRALRFLFESRHPGAPMQLLVDTGVRGLTAVAALAVSYPLTATLLGYSLRLGNDLLTSVVAAGLGPTAKATVLTTMLTAMQGQDLWAVLMIAFAVWVGALVMVSRIALLFCFVTTPLVIPLFAYSTRQEIAHWWARMFVQGLLTPIVSGVCLGMTVVVVGKTTGTPALFIGGPLASLMAILCLGFTGKAIKGCVGDLVRGPHSLLAATELAMGTAILMPLRYVSVVTSTLGPGAAATAEGGGAAAQAAADAAQAAAGAAAAAASGAHAAATGAAGAAGAAQAAGRPSPPVPGQDPGWDAARQQAWESQEGRRALEDLAGPVFSQWEHGWGRQYTPEQRDQYLQQAASANPQFAVREQLVWAAFMSRSADDMLKETA